MLRILTLFVSFGLGLSAFAGIASAQDEISSDGGYVTASDDNGGETVEGGGNDIVYGDVSTGNTGGEVLGDPNAVYYPDLSNIPTPNGQPWTPTIVGIPVGHAGAGNMFDGFDFASMVEASETAPADDVDATEGEALDEDEVPVEGEVVVDDTSVMSE